LVRRKKAITCCNQGQYMNFLALWQVMI